MWNDVAWLLWFYVAALTQSVSGGTVVAGLVVAPLPLLRSTEAHSAWG